MSRESIAVGAVSLLAAAGLTVVVQAVTQAPAVAATCSVLFDDFQYSSSADPALSARHWTVRTGGGGPGIPGASWLSSNITFPVSDGQKIMQLSSYTDGTGAGTAQTEIYHQRKFFEGTYASRVRFTDAPVSGNDGDRAVETFFTITPLAYPMEPNYGEIDFEYLPNGGWGETGPAFFETTWETYQPDPWVADNVHAVQRRSYDGWHDLVAQVANGRVKYFIDDVLVADHGDKYYPETPMSINYNLWFIDSITHSGGRSTYLQQVDWLYFAGNEVITATTARNRVNAYRGLATTYVDSVGTPGTCQEPGGGGGGSSQLNAGARLTAGQSITSANGRFRLTMQPDGNLVIYDGSSPIWATGTWNLPADRKPTRAEMQADGNLVLYNNANQAAWASGSWGPGRINPYVKMQDDGNLVIYHNGQTPVWASGTAR